METIFNYIIERLKKSLVYLIILILSIVFIWYYLPNIKYSIAFISNFDLLIRIVLTVILIFIYLLVFCFVPIVKRFNFTKKIGVGIIIDTSEVEDKSIEKQHFFKKLIFDLKHYFNVIVYDNNSFNLDDSSNLLKLYNINLGIVIEDYKSKKNGKRYYGFKIKGVLIKTFLNSVFTNNLEHKIKSELEGTLNKYIEIFEDDERDNIVKYSIYFDVVIKYIVSIIYIISNTPIKAFDMLDSIELNNINRKDRNIGYVYKNIPRRYIEAYINSIDKIIDEKDYFYNNNDKLKTIENLYGDFKIKNEIFNRQRRIRQNEYLSNINYLEFVRSIILYEQGKFDEAIDIYIKYLNKENKKEVLYDNLNVLFNLAYLYSVRGNYSDAYNIYKKISNRKDINTDLFKFSLTRVIKFINVHLDYKRDDVGIKFSCSIVNILFIDKELGYKLLEELENIDEIRKIYSAIK